MTRIISPRTASSGLTVIGRTGAARIRAEIKDMTLYAPALAGLPGIGEKAADTRALDAVVRFENGTVFLDRWNGEPVDDRLAR